MFIFNPDYSQVPLALSTEKGRVGCGTEYRFKDSHMLHKYSPDEWHPPVNAVVLLIIKGKYKIQNIYMKRKLWFCENQVFALERSKKVTKHAMRGWVNCSDKDCRETRAQFLVCTLGGFNYHSSSRIL